jgi:hypothetical protein
MAPHQQYQQSGPLRVRMEYGTKIVAGNAETTAVPQDTTPGYPTDPIAGMGRVPAHIHRLSDAGAS